MAGSHCQGVGAGESLWTCGEGAGMETWQPDPASWLPAHARCSWMAVPVDTRALGRWGSQLAAARTEQADDLLPNAPHAWRRPLSEQEAPFRGSPSAILTQRRASREEGTTTAVSVFTVSVLSDSNRAISCPGPQFLRLSVCTSLFWRFLLRALSETETAIEGTIRQRFTQKIKWGGPLVDRTIVSTWLE